MSCDCTNDGNVCVILLTVRTMEKPSEKLKTATMFVLLAMTSSFYHVNTEFVETCSHFIILQLSEISNGGVV